jgi:hypothetical protein
LKKLLINIPYSFNYRNFVLTGFVNQLAKSYEVTIYLDNGIIHDNNFKINKNARIIKTNFDRSKTIKILYRIIQQRLFFIQSTKTFEIKEKSKPFLTKILRKPFSNSKTILKIFISIHNFFCSNKKIKKQIKDFDLILFTMGHKPYENKIFVNASKNTKKINLVHSWDVITTKGCFFYDYDKTIVWSEANRIEYKKFISRILNFNNEIIIATPIQFEKYIDSNFIAGKYLLYATSVERLVPNEIIILSKILKICSDLNIKLKIRNHPQRHKKLLIKNNKIIEIESKKNESRDNANFSGSFFNNAIDEINNSFAVFSFASTIALDALCLNKKTVYLATSIKGFETKQYYYYDHLKSLIESCHIPVIKHESELAKHIIDLYNSRHTKNNSINDYIKLNNSNNILNHII